MAIVKWIKKYERRVQVVPTPLRKTNADRIRQMTDEELAKWTTTIGRTFGEEYEGYMSCLEWLKEEVDDS